MGEANEGGGGGSRGGSGPKSSHPWKVGSSVTTSYPKDLLHRLMSTASGTNLGFFKMEEEVDDEDLELNLGLSLGGRFGIDKNNSSKKLMRSSSIATTLPVFRDEDASLPTNASSYPTIVRTSSLPAETEEEWRKRKELQTLRRLEAKRRRSEKQKGSGVGCAGNANLNSNANPNNNLSCLEEGSRNEVEGGGNGVSNLRDSKQYMISALANYKSGSWVGQPFRLSNWTKQAGESGDVVAKGKSISPNDKTGGGLVRANSGFGQQRDSQGSMESQGGSSSGVSEFESKSLQGNSSAGEAKSSGSNHSTQEQSNQERSNPSQPASVKNSCRTPGPGSAENPSKRPDSRYKGTEVGANGMGDMPCVFTRGDGPNGRRIDGILYKYGKGEEVRIMCVCHGIFLSPAEFVKHAGGTDVDHPLRHIVVNTSAASFS